MKESTNTVSIKENILIAVSETYQSVFENYKNILLDNSYLPTKKHTSLGINGFTERNLTFNFCHSYLGKHPNAIVWQEIPFDSEELKRQHVDSIIIDKGKDEDNNWVIYLEAKRLYGITHFEYLLNDLKRIKKEYSNIPHPKESYTAHKAVVLLADHYFQGECKGKMYKSNYYDNYFSGKDVIELPEISKKYSELRELIDSNKINNIVDYNNNDIHITLHGKYNKGVDIKDEITYTIYCGVYFIE